MKCDVILFDDLQRPQIATEIERLCFFSKWKLWAQNALTNHVHVVAYAPGYTGAKVCDQQQANCMRVLRGQWPVFSDRPVWTEGGDWVCVNEVDDLEHIIAYVLYAQDGQESNS